MQTLTKRLLITLNALLVAGCVPTSPSNVPPINQLPLGSTVALVSEMDENISYRYVGSWEYLNSDMDYRVSHLNPDEAILPTIKAALQHDGYHAVMMHAPISQFPSERTNPTNALSPAEHAYLQRIKQGRNIERAIIFSKAPNCDFGHRGNDAFGYGYLQRDTFVYKGTFVFASVNIRVVNMQNMQVISHFKTCLDKHVRPEFFAENPGSVTVWSTGYITRWLKTDYAPALLQAMKNATIVH